MNPFWTIKLVTWTPLNNEFPPPSVQLCIIFNPKRGIKVLHTPKLALNPRMSKYNAPLCYKFNDQIKETWISLMILLELDVWIFNSAFYGCESGSQIGSWGPDSSKLLLMFSPKIVNVKNSHCELRQELFMFSSFFTIGQGSLYIFTQPNATASQKSL